MAISAEVADRPFEFSLPADWDLGPLRLQGPMEFFQEFLGAVYDARSSVRIRTMFYLPGRDFVPQITEELKDLTRRRVFGQVITDGSSYGFITQTEVGWPGKKLSPGEKLFKERNFEQMGSLRESGVKVDCSVPLRGRKWFVNFFKADHHKLFAVDSRVAWCAGGLGNLSDRCFRWIDYLAKTEEPDFVRVIEDLIGRFNHKPKENYSLEPVKGYDFLVDGGISKSLIYKKAISMVEEEETQVLFVSQLLPDGKLLDAMIDKAKKGVDISVYTSRLDESFFHLFPYKYEVKRLLWKILRSEINLKVTTLPSRVHAKGILNSRSALVTSHNLTRLNEWARVQDNGIYSEDPRLRRQLKHFIESVPV